MGDPVKVFVHIGAPKTGTTYLQRVLAANRDQLAQQGVLYPRAGEAHHQAAWGLRPESARGLDSTEFRGHWDELVAQVRAWQGHTVVISSEMFVFFDETLAAQVLGAFGDAEVHVVYSARDLLRQVPAVWQEQVKNQRTQSYGAFVLDLLGPRSQRMARHFWRAQDAPRALARWSQGLPPARVHVVTAPPRGAAPTLLWDRFAEAIGIDGGAYDAAMPVANPSLGVASTEVLRRYNERYGAQLPIRQYRREVIRPLMPVLSEAVTDTATLTLGRVQRRLLTRRCRAVADGIRSAGYDVVGTLHDLTPQPAVRDRFARAATAPEELSDRQVVDALLDVVNGMLRTQRELMKTAQAKPAAKADQRPGDGRSE